MNKLTWVSESCWVYVLQVMSIVFSWTASIFGPVHVCVFRGCYQHMSTWGFPVSVPGSCVHLLNSESNDFAVESRRGGETAAATAAMKPPSASCPSAHTFTGVANEINEVNEAPPYNLMSLQSHWKLSRDTKEVISETFSSSAAGVT